VSALRDRLAAKARRRTVFHVEISDAEDARRRVDEAQQQVTLRGFMDGASELETAKAALAAAEQELAKHYEPVEFQAATPADYEALSAAHFQDKKDDDIDIDAVLPALAAICAVEEDMRDEAWWSDQLSPATSAWSAGERSALYNRLVDLNVARPDVRIPKG